MSFEIGTNSGGYYGCTGKSGYGTAVGLSHVDGHGFDLGPGPMTGMLEYSFVTSGFISCDDSWPESYECTLKGHSVQLGMEFGLVPDSWAEPFFDVGLGIFSSEGGPAEGRTSFTPAIGGGIRFSPAGAVSWSVRVRRSWMFDDGYSNLTGEDLGFFFSMWEMEIHPQR